VILYVQGQAIDVQPCTMTVLISEPIGDGCVNDVGADVQGFRAEFRGSVERALDAQQAAEMAYLRGTAKPRAVVSSRLR